MSPVMWIRLRVIGNRFASRHALREAITTIAVLATILLLYAAVGTMDYNDALASEAEATNRTTISAPPAFGDKHIRAEFADKRTLAVKCQRLNRVPNWRMHGLEVLGCYHQDAWHTYTVVLLDTFTNQPQATTGIRAAAHECKHVHVGKFHKPGENGDESDLANYRECAEALLSTGHYLMRGQP